MSKLHTPREKKLASLALDSRNVYGENDKASRKSIPLGKQKSRKPVRRAATENLHRISTSMSDDEIVALEASIKSLEIAGKREAFRKSPDAPLGGLLEYKATGDWKLLRRPGK